jgi:hypothetical protein
MEDILDLYEQPYNPKRPVICFDERPCQLIGDAIAPIPIKPGRTKKEHCEYIRNGTCCIFLAFEPLAGKRMVCVKQQRTMVDYTNFMKDISGRYPEAETMIISIFILPAHFIKLLILMTLSILLKGSNTIILQRREAGLIWLR